MLTELPEQSASSMRTANDHHNTRPLTSWPDVISHLPRGIPSSRYLVSGNLSPPRRSRTRIHNRAATNVGPEAGSHAAPRRRDDDIERGSSVAASVACFESGCAVSLRGLDRSLDLDLGR